MRNCFHIWFILAFKFNLRRYTVGFTHGVLNTDNMSILGLTVDYGPFGFMEQFDPQYTPNITDLSERRYCYIQQPQIAKWNLAGGVSRTSTRPANGARTVFRVNTQTDAWHGLVQQWPTESHTIV